MACVDVTGIVAALSESYSLLEIDKWLDAPHPQLGGRTATALIVEGRQDEVMQVINRLRDDVYL